MAAPRPILGVSLAAFDVVIAAAGGRAALGGKTTEWLKHNFVLAATASRQCEYSSILPAELVGTANVFLSHAYDYAFLDAVDAMVTWARCHPRPDGTPHFFYFDLLVVNQHGQDAVVPFEVLRDEFGAGVRGVGHTLFLLDFEHPVSLTRTWCVFEAATSLACGARFEVIMASRSVAAFEGALSRDFDAVVTKMCAIDVESAKATKAADQENVSRAILEIGGPLRVNQMILDSLREWMAKAGAAMLATMPEGLERAAAAQSLAKLFIAMGRFEDAVPLLRGALAQFSQGPLTSTALQCMSDLGHALHKRERMHSDMAYFARVVDSFDEAFFLLRYACEGQTGLERAATLCRLHALGRNYTDGAMDPDSSDELSFEARDGWVKEAHALQLAALGPDHADVHASLLLIADAESRSGNRGVVHAMNAAIFESCNRTYGEMHPHTMAIRSRLAVSAVWEKRVAESKDHSFAVLKWRLKAFGLEHIETHDAFCAIFSPPFSTTIYTAAERVPLYPNFLECIRRTFPTDLTDTSNCISRRAFALMKWSEDLETLREKAACRSRAAEAVQCMALHWRERRVGHNILEVCVKDCVTRWLSCLTAPDDYEAILAFDATVGDFPFATVHIYQHVLQQLTEYGSEAHACSRGVPDALRATIASRAVVDPTDSRWASAARKMLRGVAELALGELTDWERCGAI
jgi:hypothetical protein